MNFLPNILGYNSQPPRSSQILRGNEFPCHVLLLGKKGYKSTSSLPTSFCALIKAWSIVCRIERMILNYQVWHGWWSGETVRLESFIVWAKHTGQSPCQNASLRNVPGWVLTDMVEFQQNPCMAFKCDLIWFLTYTI